MESSTSISFFTANFDIRSLGSAKGKIYAGDDNGFLHIFHGTSNLERIQVFNVQPIHLISITCKNDILCFSKNAGLLTLVEEGSWKFIYSKKVIEKVSQVELHESRNLCYGLSINNDKVFIYKGDISESSREMLKKIQEVEINDRSGRMTKAFILKDLIVCSENGALKLFRI